MKLKKIASLALAGVMAVSMLAGCEGGKGNDNNNPDNGQPVITTTPVVDAVNKGQKSTNAVKIKFTKNDSLDAALAKALGFTGKASISPRHVEGINRVFSPSQAEIDYAYEVMEAIRLAKEQGRGAVALRGKMIDAPIVERARQTIAMAREMGLGREDA